MKKKFINFFLPSVIAISFATSLPMITFSCSIANTAEISIDLKQTSNYFKDILSVNLKELNDDEKNSIDSISQKICDLINDNFGSKIINSKEDITINFNNQDTSKNEKFVDIKIKFIKNVEFYNIENEFFTYDYINNELISKAPYASGYLNDTLLDIDATKVDLIFKEVNKTIMNISDLDNFETDIYNLRKHINQNIFPQINYFSNIVVEKNQIENSKIVSLSIKLVFNKGIKELFIPSEAIVNGYQLVKENNRFVLINKSINTSFTAVDIGLNFTNIKSIISSTVSNIENCEIESESSYSSLEAEIKNKIDELYEINPLNNVQIVIKEPKDLKQVEAHVELNFIENLYFYNKPIFENSGYKLEKNKLISSTYNTKMHSFDLTLHIEDIQNILVSNAKQIKQVLDNYSSNESNIVNELNKKFNNINLFESASIQLGPENDEITRKCNIVLKISNSINLINYESLPTNFQFNIQDKTLSLNNLDTGIRTLKLNNYIDGLKNLVNDRIHNINNLNSINKEFNESIKSALNELFSNENIVENVSVELNDKVEFKNASCNVNIDFYRDLNIIIDEQNLNENITLNNHRLSISNILTQVYVIKINETTLNSITEETKQEVLKINRIDHSNENKYSDIMNNIKNLIELKIKVDIPSENQIQVIDSIEILENSYSNKNNLYVDIKINFNPLIDFVNTNFNNFIFNKEENSLTMSKLKTNSLLIELTNGNLKTLSSFISIKMLSYTDAEKQTYEQLILDEATKILLQNQSIDSPIINTVTITTNLESGSSYFKANIEIIFTENISLFGNPTNLSGFNIEVLNINKLTLNSVLTSIPSGSFM